MTVHVKVCHSKITRDCQLNVSWLHNLHQDVLIVERPLPKKCRDLQLRFWGPLKSYIFRMLGWSWWLYGAVYVWICGQSMGCHRHPMLFLVESWNLDFRENNIGCLWQPLDRPQIQTNQCPIQLVIRTTSTLKYIGISWPTAKINPWPLYYTLWEI